VLSKLRFYGPAAGACSCKFPSCFIKRNFRSKLIQSTMMSKYGTTDGKFTMGEGDGLVLSLNQMQLGKILTKYYTVQLKEDIHGIPWCFARYTYYRINTPESFARLAGNSKWMPNCQMWELNSCTLYCVNFEFLHDFSVKSLPFMSLKLIGSHVSFPDISYVKDRPALSAIIGLSK